MKKIYATLVLLASILTPSCARQTPPIDVSGLSEASMNFDQAGVGPFLSELSETLAPGFDSSAAEEVTSAIDSLDVDQTGNWEFRVGPHGKPQRLVIVAYKDDIDAPDLAFYTSPALAARIQEQMQSFAAAQGW